MAMELLLSLPLPNLQQNCITVSAVKVIDSITWDFLSRFALMKKKHTHTMISHFWIVQCLSRFAGLHLGLFRNCR